MPQTRSYSATFSSSVGTSYPSGRPFRCACIQVQSGPNLARNLAAVSAQLDDRQSREADLVLLPEAVDLLDPDLANVRAHAAPLAEHVFVKALQTDERLRGKWLLIGSVTARSSQGDLVNRSVLVDPRGEIVVEYDKIHLFDAPAHGDNEVPESRLYRAGSVAKVATLPWARIGLSICYDLRFPQLFRALAHAGATVLCVPAAFLRSTGQAHWHALLRARAIENGCYVIAPAQCGSPHPGRRNYGHSLIVDPWGTVLVDGGEAPGVISAEIDPAAVVRARTALPCLDHERGFTLSVDGAGQGSDGAAHAG